MPLCGAFFPITSIYYALHTATFLANSPQPPFAPIFRLQQAGSSLTDRLKAVLILLIQSPTSSFAPLFIGYIKPEYPAIPVPGRHFSAVGFPDSRFDSNYLIMYPCLTPDSRLAPKSDIFCPRPRSPLQ